MSEYKLLDEFEEKLTDDRITIKSKDGSILHLDSDDWDELRFGKPSAVLVSETNEGDEVPNYIDVRPVDGGEERFGLSPQEAVEYVEQHLLE